ncbi:hypothetical protein PybrP1_004224 [[Pythium] brassicae (nom. inval.)]|nr:hypothetical protein PybrP1_004224 [[Pythium] brassicae (nom. inval.)]
MEKSQASYPILPVQPPCPAIIHGIGAVSDRYDVFLVDQYGVLHNGSEPYPGAIDCFARLLAQPSTSGFDGGAARIVLLSNTSKRSAGLREKLAAFGFDPRFLGAVTGGEVAWGYLNSRRDHLQRCALLTADVTESVAQRKTNPQSLFHGLDLEVVDVDAAQFLLVEGSRQVCYSAHPSEALHTNFHSTGELDDQVREFLQRGRARDLLMLCTNPDLVAVIKDDRIAHMGGTIAKLYEEMGGRVEYFGKPRKEHFQLCLDMAGATDRARVVHIGDSLHHDVQGAANTGIDSIFIAGGVHARELGMFGSTEGCDDDNHGASDGGGGEGEDGGGEDGNDTSGGSRVAVQPKPLQDLCDKVGVYPTFTVPRFVW